MDKHKNAAQERSPLILTLESSSKGVEDTNHVMLAHDVTHLFLAGLCLGEAGFEGDEDGDVGVVAGAEAELLVDVTRVLRVAEQHRRLVQAERAVDLIQQQVRARSVTCHTCDDMVHGPGKYFACIPALRTIANNTRNLLSHDSLHTTATKCTATRAFKFANAN